MTKLRNMSIDHIVDVSQVDLHAKATGRPFIISATIVGKRIGSDGCSVGILLGWKQVDAPYFAYDRATTHIPTVLGYLYSLSIGSYDFFMWVDPDINANKASPTVSNNPTYGHTCDKCQYYNEYACHDATKSKFVCTGCKMGW